jgi:anti-sigma factor RsiW
MSDLRVADPLVCRQLVELVTDWLEDALGETQRAEVEEHLAICPGCVAYVGQLRATTRALGRLGAEAPTLPSVGRGRLLAAFRAWRDG